MKRRIQKIKIALFKIYKAGNPPTSRETSFIDHDLAIKGKLNFQITNINGMSRKRFPRISTMDLYLTDAPL